MRGIGYLIVEIVVLLVASAAIGYLIGRVLHRGGRATPAPATSGSGSETRTLVLEGRLSETQAELEEVKRQLTLERLRSQDDSGPS